MVSYPILRNSADEPAKLLGFDTSNYECTHRNYLESCHTITSQDAMAEHHPV